MIRLCIVQCNKDIASRARNIAAIEHLAKSVFLLHILEMKSLKKTIDNLFAMENTTTDVTVVLTLAFGLILGSIGSLRLVSAQENTTAGGGNNLTGVSTGPGAAIPGNVTNPTNATSSPSAVGGGNMTSPTTANVANQTAATMQIGGQ